MFVQAHVPAPLSTPSFLPLSFAVPQSTPRYRYLHHSTLDKMEEALNAQVDAQSNPPLLCHPHNPLTHLRCVSPCTQILSIRDANRDVCTGKPQPPSSSSRVRSSHGGAVAQDDLEDDEEDDGDVTDEEDEDEEDDGEVDEAEEDEMEDEDDSGALPYEAVADVDDHNSSISAQALQEADARYAEDSGDPDFEGAVEEMTDEEYARALQAEEDLYAQNEEAGQQMAMAEEEDGAAG